MTRAALIISLIRGTPRVICIHLTVKEYNHMSSVMGYRWSDILKDGYHNYTVYSVLCTIGYSCLLLQQNGMFSVSSGFPVPQCSVLQLHPLLSQAQYAHA